MLIYILQRQPGHQSLSMFETEAHVASGSLQKWLHSTQMYQRVPMNFCMDAMETGLCIHRSSRSSQIEVVLLLDRPLNAWPWASSQISQLSNLQYWPVPC